ncbi:MAG: biopolymer transport protein ExbB [Desulfonauticus sp.]|jgi:biopolymer transport protein ExbB|nr:MAG: putative biopolymer transport protein related to ExbB [Desulfonauticus sp. 38_4375]MDK2922093.1 biopolymer transport protein ExbB [Desulfonauticus sp.]
MLDLLEKGGFLVIPILGCSVLSLTIFMERCFRFFLWKRQKKEIGVNICAYLRKKDVSSALKIALESKSPLGRVLAKAIEVIKQDRETIETVLLHAIEEEVDRFSKYLQVLATIGNVTPLLGLLGTVIGMIKAFMVIEEMGGKVNASVLAGGIWEAMLTTALGLAVALPTMLAHSYLVAQVNKLEAKLRDGSVEFIKVLSVF